MPKIATIIVGSVLVLAIGLGIPNLATGSPDLVTEDLTGPLTPEDLAGDLAGAGVTVSNVTYTGADVAAGRFSGGSGIIGFESGVILSSGDVANVVGPNVLDDISTVNGTPGDADLDALSGFTTFDAAILEFDFVPDTDTVLFRYVFASDEYNEWVHTEFNDVFAFFINGINCAVVNGDPVSINTINNGNPYGSEPAENPDLFINNDLDDGGGTIDTEMDGLTKVLTCVASVTPGAANHMKLAIADASDEILDVNVFLKAASIVPVPPGDADCSLAVSIVDALLDAQFVVGLIAFIPCPGAADVNDDGVINIIDALLIAQFVVGLIEEFPTPPTPTPTP